MTNYVIGFLRADVSGEQWRQDEARIHTLAEKCGWSVVLGYFGDPKRPGAVINRLMNLAYAECVNEVIAPSVDHFEPDDLAALVKIADVICADTGTRYTIPTDGAPQTPSETDSGWGGGELMKSLQPGPNGNSYDPWNMPVNADDDGQTQTGLINRR
ncbi:hypothetical protein ACFRAQ_06165 [Nocardia sp. NPDC056611]|uniref:hypothetical protein n=1 Tax=Nocardia sp. NPDC056611 TaxID=3345877 RepID=UPI00367031B0